jgi:hypothetical protein
VAGLPGEFARHLTFFAGILFGGVAFGILCLLWFPVPMARLASRIAGALREEWREPVWHLVMQVVRGLSPLKRPVDAAWLFLQSAAIWLIEACMFLLVLPAFGLEFRYDWALLAMTVTNLGIVLPSSPGYIGPFHYFCAKTLTLLGVGTVVATSYAVAVHLVFYMPITLWGVGVVMRYGVEIGMIVTRSRQRSQQNGPVEIDGVPMWTLGPVETVTPSSQPGGLVTAITRALLPEHPTVKEASEQQVILFVHQQMEALPRRLRILVGVALVGFRVVVRVRYLRSFCGLPRATQRRVIEKWAYHGWTLQRQLFRPFRSTALLAFYELDEVQAEFGVHRAEHKAQILEFSR